MSDKKTVLAVGAHPDDVEILCAGTLALLKEKGWEIVISTMTAGDCGSAKLNKEEISAIRIKEAKRLGFSQVASPAKFAFVRQAVSQLLK